MDKIIVNGKEIEIGQDGMIPLSDEELENASGGLQLPRDVMFYQWCCRVPGCGYKSDWYDDSSECRSNLVAHYFEKNHLLYDYNVKYLD
jgi:hypothetical protein